MDILKDVNENVSSMVRSSFDEFISSKVKEEIEKGKDKFLNDLNMCEEEYPVFKPSNELSEEIVNVLKSSLDYYQLVNSEHPDYRHVLNQEKKNYGGTLDESKFNEEYGKIYKQVLDYYQTLTEYPQLIIEDNHFLIHFKGSKAYRANGKKDESFGYGITNKGIIYQNIRKANPYYLLKTTDRMDTTTINRLNRDNGSSSMNIKFVIMKEQIQRDAIRNFKQNIYPMIHNYTPPSRKAVILSPNENYKKDVTNSGFHLYDTSKFIKKGNGKCRPDWLCSIGTCCSVKTTPFHEGSGCRHGVYAIKQTNTIEYEEENYAARRSKKPYPKIKKIKTETTYSLEGDMYEDAVRRYMEDDICQECGAGELLFSIEEIGFDPKVINKYPLNNEYIDILHLIKPDNLEIIFSIQTIYAKYHPRANENHVIEEKIKKLTNLEEAVNERVSEEKDRLKQLWVKYHKGIKERNERVEKEKIDYKAKINEINDKRKNNIDDKNTIKEMIKLTKDKCNKKETEFNDKLAKQEYDFEKKVLKHEEDRQKEKEDYRNKLSELIVITNDINEINENQEDESCKSDELFEIIKKLKSLNK